MWVTTTGLKAIKSIFLVIIIDAFMALGGLYQSQMSMPETQLVGTDTVAAMMLESAQQVGLVD